MPIYSNSAFGPPFKTIARMGTQTEPNYLFGKFEFKTEPFTFKVTQVAITSDVATLTVQLVSGGGPNASLLPSVGAKMGVQGTQTNSGAFNVDPAIVTASTVSAATGAGTISYALSHADVVAIADSGTLVVQPFETPDLVASLTASAPIALIFTPDESDNSRCLFAEAKWSGTMPSAATVVLQAANIDDDSRYVVLTNSQGCAPGGVVASSDALATITGSAVTQAAAEYSFIMGKFIRAKVLSMSGGDGTTGLIVTVFA